MLEMLKARKESLKKRGVKGFTLMEMLIVIAIIAVLVAIAIPVLGAQLDRAKATTDEANIRDGYASAQVMILQPYKADGTKMTDAELNTTWYLQKDGSIAASGDNNYVTQGNSSALGTDVEVAGVDVTWTSGKNITFTIKNGKLDSIAPTA